MNKKIFNNTKRAFTLKDKKGLKRSLFIFKMLNRPIMVKMGTTLSVWALKLKLPVKSIIRKTIFWQFCGGESQKECVPVVEELYTKNVSSVLFFSSEGNETDSEFDKALEREIGIMKFATKRKEIPYVVFKPTGVGRFMIWEKVSSDQKLTESEAEEWEKIKTRVHKICKTAFELKVYVLADAEETWMQDAADDLLEEMMVEFNKEEPIVYNTVQCYRWDRLVYIKKLHQRALNKGFKVGVKIVRGAYMEKENARAKKKGYPTPICEDKEATDVNFNAVMSFCLQNINEFGMFVGSHNEVSTYLAIQLMEEKGLAKDDERIWFSQLYGMSDHITFNLALNGYNAAKYMPFGPIDEVVPYLIRRAQENSSVKGQTGRELALLKEEQQRRQGTYVKRIE